MEASCRYDARQVAEMKLPRSLRFYVAASTFYAAVVFFGVQFLYTLQLAQSGLIVARRDTGDVLASIQVVSFVVWLGISLIAGVIMHRLASALAGAKTAEEQKDHELGSIFGLSASLAGPLDLEEIGKHFVAAVRGALAADARNIHCQRGPGRDAEPPRDPRVRHQPTLAGARDGFALIPGDAWREAKDGQARRRLRGHA